VLAQGRQGDPHPREPRQEVGAEALAVDKGGEIVAEGTPEQVAKEPRSYTGGYLGPLLKNAVRPEPVEGPLFASRKRRQREPAE